MVRFLRDQTKKQTIRALELYVSCCCTCKICSCFWYRVFREPKFSSELQNLVFVSNKIHRCFMNCLNPIGYLMLFWCVYTSHHTRFHINVSPIPPLHTAKPINMPCTLQKYALIGHINFLSKIFGPHFKKTSPTQVPHKSHAKSTKNTLFWCSVVKKCMFLLWKSCIFHWF